MLDRVLYVVLLGFAVGIAWSTAVSVSLVYAELVVSIGVGVLMLTLRMREGVRQTVVLIALFCFATTLGITRASWSAPAVHSALDTYVGEEVVIEGVVVDEPDRRETNTRVTVQPSAIGPQAVQGSERILISYPRFPDVAYGDRIIATGTLTFPEDFETDAGRIFAYQSYLHKDGIRYLMSFSEIVVIGHGEGSWVLTSLFTLKRKYLDSIGNTIAEPEASLLGGITVGAKESLGSDIAETFRAVGIIHIVVLSGYNISIVADTIMRVVSFGGYLPRGVSLAFGASGVVLFALMAGASATVVRASIMALLVVAARSTGRVYDIAKALMIAGFCMVLHSPYILIYDPSFQLSFVATLGLIILGPFIENKITFVPTTLGLREFTTATVSTQIFVLPLLLYQSGQLSLVSLVANLMVLIAVPYAMLTGFLAGIFGWIHITLAYPFAFIAQLLLSYILLVADLLARIPLASITIPVLPIWAVVLLYAVIALWYKRLATTTRHLHR